MKSPETKDYDFGTIKIYTRSAQEPMGTMGIEGSSCNTPELVSRMHERVWQGCWQNKAKSVGLDYSLTKNQFSKSAAADATWSEDDTRTITNIMESLLEEYDQATDRYNNFFARPAREQAEKDIGMCVDF